MFDFFDEMFGEIEKHNYRYQVDSGKKIVVEGYKNVLKIEENCVLLKLKTNEMEILGCSLKVVELGTNTIKIVGIIKSVVITGGENEK